MLKRLYTIYDKVAMEAGPIMQFNTDEAAQRAYPKAFNGDSAPMSDFMICYIGDFDTELMNVNGIDLAQDITPVVSE